MISLIIYTPSILFSENQKHFAGQIHSSVLVCLPNMYETLGLIPNTNII
jgi:hypothetical protein